MGGFLKTTLCTSAGVSGIDFTSGRTTGTGTTSDERRTTARGCRSRRPPWEQRSYGGAREAVHDATQDVHGDQENHKREVQADRAQVEGRDHLPDRLERWVGGRVDDLETRRHQPGWPPTARQHHHPVDDEPCEEQHEEDEQDRREDVPEESHGPRSSKGTRGAGPVMPPASGLGGETALADPRLVLCRHVDVPRAEQEHLVRDALDATAQPERQTRSEVDEP